LEFTLSDMPTGLVTQLLCRFLFQPIAGGAELRFSEVDR